MSRPKFDIKYYNQQKDYLRKKFESERTGEQDLLYENTKLFKPVLTSQQQIQDKISEGQNILQPFTQELQRRNDLMETSQYLPFYQAPMVEDVPRYSTPQKPVIYVDPDKDLNTTDRENLDDLSLDLPSVVQQRGSFDNVFKQIKTKNKEIGQHLGKNSKKSDKEKEILESQKQTLKKYKNAIRDLQGAEQFITKKGEGIRRVNQKRGRPRKYPAVFQYRDATDLIYKLQEYITAKDAGNTGLDNTIISMLDELLHTKVISKSEYDNLYKNNII